ncbi:hypothetical protein Tco_0381973, partial [Tanacetum coccineum]
RDVVIVVASVLIGGGVTSNDGLDDDTSVKGAITGGVEELKRIVKIKGVKKEALHSLRQKPEHPSETKVFHNEDGNPARANIKQALGSYERPHKGVKASANSDIVYFFTSAQDGDPLQDDEIRKSSRIDDEVVKDQRQRDDNDLQDERQDQPEEEEVEPRRRKRARTEKEFEPDFVSFMVENEPTSYREAVTSSE